MISVTSVLVVNAYTEIVAMRYASQTRWIGPGVDAGGFAIACACRYLCGDADCSLLLSAQVGSANVDGNERPRSARSVLPVFIRSGGARNRVADPNTHFPYVPANRNSGTAGDSSGAIGS